MKTFRVELITPDKILFNGDIVRLVVTLRDGGVEVLADHVPSLCDLTAGKCEITLPDNTRKVFASNDGILNIRKDKVVITSDLLEWEEDLEKALDVKEKHVKDEYERRKQSFAQHRLTSVALARAFANLRNNKPDNQ